MKHIASNKLRTSRSIRIIFTSIFTDRVVIIEYIIIITSFHAKHKYFNYESKQLTMINNFYLSYLHINFY